MVSFLTHIQDKISHQVYQTFEHKCDIVLRKSCKKRCKFRQDIFLVGADLEEPPVLVGSRRLIEPIAAVGRHSGRPIQPLADKCTMYTESSTNFAGITMVKADLL